MTYGNRLREQYKNEYTFSKRDVQKLFSKDKISNEYLDQLLHNLVKQNKIIRITNGAYTFNKDLMVSGFAYSPFYYGLQEALSLRNLHEQETNPVIITTKKIKPGIKQIQGNNVLLRRIDRKYFFGIDFVKYYNIEIPVSDLEKTLIDFIYYNEPLSEDAKNGLLKNINKQKLKEYLLKYPESTRRKVQSFIK